MPKLLFKELNGKIPHGSLITDSNKKVWIVGSFVGVDESVEIYAATEYKGDIPSNYPAFLKIEANGNETITSEINFYKQHANPTEIDKWIETKNIQYDLGIPRYLGSAQNVKIANTHFDYLVLERYGSDLQTLLVKHGNLFPKPTVLKIAYHIVHALEYFHRRGIMHGDLRARNIRLHLRKKCRIYLLPQLRASDESDRDAVIFWSEDRHDGATTKRGDFESLLYNLIDWSGGVLPWKNALPDEAKIMKNQAFEDPQKFLQDAFPTCECDDSSGCLVAGKCATSGEPVLKCLQAIAELMEQLKYMKKMRYREPNYTVIQEILEKRLLRMYHIPTSKLEFSVPTVIGDEDDEGKSRKDKAQVPVSCNVFLYIPGLGIAIDVLATIIAENCSSFHEVDTFDRRPDVIEVILQTKKMSRACAVKSSIILKAWEEDMHGLRTMVIEQWRLKGLAPGGYEAWKRAMAKRGRRESTGDAKEVKKITITETETEKKVVEVVRSLRPHGSSGSSSSSSSSPAKLSNNGSPIVTMQDARPSCPSSSSDFQSSAAGNNTFSSYRSDHHDYFNSDSTLTMEKVLDKVRHQWPKEIVIETRGALDRTVARAIEDRSNVSVTDEQWHESYIWLKAWLGVREKMLKVFGPISSDPQTMADQLQELRVLRDECSKPELVDRLTHLTKVRAKLTADSDEARKLNRIEQSWLKQLAWLEESARKLGDKNLPGADILIWLVKELEDMSEKLLVSTDCATLQLQKKRCQVAHQRVANKETEVSKLLNEGRDVFARSPNLKNSAFQQLFLDVMQSQWDRLKKRSSKNSSRLQSCLEHYDKYYDGLNEFLHWLSNSGGKLKDLRPISLDGILNELSSLGSEFREKLSEIERNVNLGQTFVAACDVDEDDLVKNELVAMKDEWDKLNNELLQRTQTFQEIKERYAKFNENLLEIKNKIEQYELGDALEGAVIAPHYLDRIKELREKWVRLGVRLQESLGDVRQQVDELASRFDKQGIDASSLLENVNLVASRIANLKVKLVNSCKEIFDRELVGCGRQLRATKPAEREIETAVRERVEIVDLVSSDESDIVVESSSLQRDRCNFGKTWKNRERCSRVRKVRRKMERNPFVYSSDDDESENNKKSELYKKKRKNYTTSNLEDSDSDYGSSRSSRNLRSRKNNNHEYFGSKLKLIPYKLRSKSGSYLKSFRPKKHRRLVYSSDSDRSINRGINSTHQNDDRNPSLPSFATNI